MPRFRPNSLPHQPQRRTPPLFNSGLLVVPANLLGDGKLPDQRNTTFAWDQAEDSATSYWKAIPGDYSTDRQADGGEVD